eukprot:4894959-Pleurochrysis_carterae.AAC.2
MRLLNEVCASCSLDMDPAAPFGQCECGQPKGLHSAEALKAGKLPSTRKSCSSRDMTFPASMIFCPFKQHLTS